MDPYKNIKQLYHYLCILLLLHTLLLFLLFFYEDSLVIRFQQKEQYVHVQMIKIQAHYIVDYKN